MATASEEAFSEARNRESARELGWDPSWFGLDADDFGPTLTAAVEAFQASSLGIVGAEEDDGDLPGIVGWATFLRLHAALEADEDDPDAPVPEEEASGLLMIDGEPMPVPFAVRQLPIERYYYRCETKTDGERCNGKRYSSPGRCSKCGKKRKRGRRFAERGGKPDRVIWHWPVTESSRKTHRFLSAKGISSNGEISWDGTLVQFCDLKFRTFHAGSRANNAGLGFDVSLNPVRKSKIEKAQRKIERLGRPPRPVLEGVTVHGWRPGPILYYYDRQLVTVAKLRAALHVFLDVPLASPRESGRLTFQHEARQSFMREARGHFNHSDCSGKKWDACISDETWIESAGMTLIDLAREIAEGMTA